MSSVGLHNAVWWFESPETEDGVTTVDSPGPISGYHICTGDIAYAAAFYFYRCIGTTTHFALIDLSRSHCPQANQ